MSLHFDVPDDALRPPPPGRPHKGPARIYRPTETAGVAEVVREAADAAVWLDSPCAPARRDDDSDPAGRECWRISLEHMTRVLEVDRPRRCVRVQAGLRVGDLVTALAHHGLSLPSVTPPLALSVAGAVSRTSLASHVDALAVVMASGAIVELTPDGDALLMRAALQGFGAVGVVTEVTLRVVDSATWCVQRERLPLEVAASRFVAAAENDPEAQRHALVWWPHCAWAIAERTDFQVDGRAPAHDAKPARARLWPERLASALVLVSARWPELLRWLQPLAARLSPPTGTSMDAATSVQNARERPAPWRLDAMVPLQQVASALRAVTPLLRSAGAHLTRPVRVRAMPPSVSLLSLDQGRVMALLSVCSTSDEVEPTLRARLIAVLVEHDARPTAPQTSWSDALAEDAAERATALLSLSQRVDPAGLFRGPAFLRLFSP